MTITVYNVTLLTIADKEMVMERRFYVLKQVMEITGFSRAHLYNENSRGKLVLKKAGGRTVVMVEDFERWVESFDHVGPPSKAAA